ncbi:MAG: PLP-dependent aminotransferase family protein [Lachnospiraceae bacterium]|nr:PLP-dependent aminotransferase family protein [Lachnospiraceae bacterium]
MKLGVDRNRKEPAYLQLYYRLRGYIADGTLAFGTKLPSKRILSEDAGVSVITAEHALALLAEEGYIETKERSGYYVIYRSDAYYMPDPADLSADKTAGAQPEKKAEKGTFPFPAFAKIMRRVLAEQGEKILVKPPSQGCPELREAIADYLAISRDIRVKPSQIVIGSGAEYLYMLIVQMLGRGCYALEDPSYEKIRRVYEANGAACEMLPMGRDGIRSEALSSAKAKILHVTPFHSYPTGVTATAGKRREYIRWATERGGTLIEDDFDSEFSLTSKAVDTLFSLEPERSVIYLNTFSETIAPSMRVGYMILPAARARELLSAISFYSCTVPAFDQYVLAEFLRSGEFARHVNRVRRMRRRLSGAERGEGK